MKKKCHFIGIGGIGMSGLARILLSKKVPVSGSDMASSYVTDGLKQAGAEVFIGHAAQHVEPNSTVIYSTDIKKDNPEYQEALKLKCKMLHRSDLLLELMKGHKTLAVAGTHGKTTTTALLAAVLEEAGMHPSYAVGGIVKQWQANAGHGDGEYFVAEADESDGTFLKYSPYGAIITNIDLDHMNHFGTEDVLMDAFRYFAIKVESPKHLVWCGDDSRLQKLLLPGISYGFGSECDVRAVNVIQNGWTSTFDIEYAGKIFPKVKLALIGRHNVLNALAVFGLAMALKVSDEALRKAFAAFEGVVRRCEKKGETNNILLLDDYAHHPTEIITTLAGIRSAIGKKRLVAIFQPHRYSRTKDCLGTFSGIFDSVDELIITDIFGAGETPIPGLTYATVKDEIQKNSSISCRYIPRKDLAQALATSLKPQDVAVTLGAGDITKLSGEILALWKKV